MQHSAPWFRRMLLAPGLLVPALVLAACGSSAGDTSANGTGGAGGGSYKIVLVADLSGAFSGVAAPGAAGATVAIDNINANGGINGRKISFEVVDSQSSPAGALAAVRKAVADQPLAILMSSGSGGAAAITALVQSAKVPFISAALNDSTVYPAQPYLYQPSLTAKQTADALYQFSKQKLGGSVSGKTIDIAAINSPYVDSIINEANNLLKADGATFGKTERYDLPLASFATQAGAISRDKPAAVLVLGSTDDSVVVSKALTAAGVNGLQVGIPSGAAETTIQQINSKNYYAVTATPYPSTLPDFLSIAAKYGKKADVSSSVFSMAGWVAAYAVDQALTRCGASCDAASLNSALEQLSSYTVPDRVSYGTVAFSPTDHAAVQTVKFHGYDPATKQFTESNQITVH